MRRRNLVGALLVAFLAACDMGQFTVNTTAKVLQRAQPSLKQESDYELAARAIPGTLKTVEGFWVVSPDNEKLIAILTEGYCQYGTAFVEDEWEVAKIAKDLDRVAELDARSTRMFMRCLNFALRSLGGRWQTELFGTPEQVAALLKGAGGDQRNALMWAAYALGSIINHNLQNIEIIAHKETVMLMFQRIIELDKTQVTRDKANKIVFPPAKAGPSDRTFAALPHIALGMLFSVGGKDIGGDPDKAEAHFQTAIHLTDGKYLLPKTMYGFRVGKMTQNKDLYRKTLIEVLTTPPSIWPEQRLANEVAHRRARRYLKHEKELF
jgi:hypothetical protein